MARLLLDSTVFIDIVRGDVGLALWLDQARRGTHTLAVTALVVGEVMGGTRLHDRARLLRAFALLEFWETTFDDAVRAGTMRYDLARQGFVLHLADSLIAAVALREDATIVTRNAKDFLHFGVPVLDPSAAG